MPGALFKKFCGRLDLVVGGRLLVQGEDGTPCDLTAEWQALREELAAERCENCAHVTLEHTNGTTVFCAHPEMWNNRARDFYCSNFTKKEP